MKSRIVFILLSFCLTLGILFSFACGNGQGEVKAFLSLRSSYKTLDQEEFKSLLKSYGFFDFRLNKSGNFQGQYTLKTLEGDKVLADNRLNLMWHQSGSDLLIFKEAKKWIKNLNRSGYAGFNDWRLPTIEEAASLLNRKSVNRRYLNQLFSKEQISIWTGDSYSEYRIWAVNFNVGSTFKDGLNDANFVRPVRSSK